MLLDRVRLSTNRKVYLQRVHKSREDEGEALFVRLRRTGRQAGSDVSLHC